LFVITASATLLSKVALVVVVASSDPVQLQLRSDHFVKNPCIINERHRLCVIYISAVTDKNECAYFYLFFTPTVLNSRGLKYYLRNNTYIWKGHGANSEIGNVSATL